MHARVVRIQHVNVQEGQQGILGVARLVLHGPQRVVGLGIQLAVFGGFVDDILDQVNGLLGLA